MREKLINFFFDIQKNVVSNENNTMSISLDIKSRFGSFGLFLWTILETIREKDATKKGTKKDYIRYMEQYLYREFSSIITEL